MASYEELKGNYRTLYKSWQSCIKHEYPHAIECIAEELSKTTQLIEKAFRAAYDLHDSPPETLLSATEEEQLRYLTTGKGMLSVCAPFIKPQEPKLQYILASTKMTHIDPELPIAVIFEGISQQGFVDLEQNVKPYFGLSITGMAARFVDSGFSLQPVHLPLDLSQVSSFQVPGVKI